MQMTSLPFTFLAGTSAAASGRIPHHSLVWSSSTSQSIAAGGRSIPIHAAVHHRPRVVRQPLSFPDEISHETVRGAMEPKRATCRTSVIVCLPFCIVMVQEMAEVVSRHFRACIKSFASLKPGKRENILHNSSNSLKVRTSYNVLPCSCIHMIWKLCEL
jgi:hypothetical protein